MKNKYLNYGLLFSRILMIVLGTALISVIILLIGELTNVVSAAHWIYINEHTSSLTLIFGKKPIESEISTSFVFYAFLKAMLILGLWIYILKLIQSILASAEDFVTFQKGNIYAFRKIGTCFLILSLFELFSFVQTDDHLKLVLTIPFTYLALTLAAYLLSEVFREGYELYEQNRLMI